MCLKEKKKLKYQSILKYQVWCDLGLTLVYPLTFIITICRVILKQQKTHRTNISYTVVLVVTTTLLLEIKRK